MALTTSEKKILKKIKKWMREFLNGDIHSANTTTKRYDFWFIYDRDPNGGDDVAVSWEGGWDMSLTNQFRNQYSIEQGKKIKKNWEG